MIVKVQIHREDEGYWAEVPALPGCYTQADSLDELKRNLREAIEGYLLVAQDAAGSEAGELLDLAL